MAQHLSPSDYPRLLDCLTASGQVLPEALPTIRYLCRTDLYFLLRYVLNRKDVEHPWIYDRIRMVQDSPDGHLDLWARGHYKSTAITFAKTIQDILASHGDEPLFQWKGKEPTFGIFSHTRPIAKAFLRQIKDELERNDDLKDLFPDILYRRPAAEAPRWSEDNGITVKRKSNPKESTVEAWGLVDGQPTSKHFDVLVYDDTVTRESVTTPEMIQKTTAAWELSLNLGSIDTRLRGIGTRYSWGDTYAEIMKRKALIPRIFPATDDGTLTGKPVLLSQEGYERKIREMGPITASAQLMQNPTSDSSQNFRREWLRHFDDPGGWVGMNRALLVDPASEKKRGSDWTAIAVVGLGPDSNYYLLDMVRDRLNLKERAAAVIRLHRKWRPQRVGYEKYGMQGDIEYLREVQARENYRFHIEELGGQVSKLDRIRRMVPIMAEGRFWFPTELHYTQYDSRTVDLIEILINEELMTFPVGAHDDALDAISRIFDLDLAWPKQAADRVPDRYSKGSRSTGSWMSR